MSFVVHSKSYLDFLTVPLIAFAAAVVPVVFVVVLVIRAQ